MCRLRCCCREFSSRPSRSRMLRIALMGGGLSMLEHAMRDLQRFASLVWVTFLLLGVSVPALAQQECDANLPDRHQGARGDQEGGRSHGDC